jgi:hypothetical protein
MLITICNLCNYILLATPGSLENKEVREKIIFENENHPLTHYMLCESDRLRVPADTIVNTDQTIAFKVKQQVSEFDWISHDFFMPSEIDNEKYKMRVDGPVIYLVNSDGCEARFENTFLFLDVFTSKLGTLDSLAEILKLTVMYVGKTEITSKYIRFDGHEKLNSVFSEVVEKRPNREVWIKMLSFHRPFTNMLLVPEIDSPFRHDWLSGGGLLKNLPEEQLKSAIEGVLIKYFQPPLNKQLKKNFPSDRHASYSYFYEHTVRSIVVELHEEWRSYVTGSNVTPYNKIKLIEYALCADDIGIFLHDNATQDLDKSTR